MKRKKEWTVYKERGDEKERARNIESKRENKREMGDKIEIKSKKKV